MECREKLIRLRKRQGLTQQELAETVNVSRQSISKWELGAAQPSIENFRSLSTFYGVPVDLLLNDVTFRRRGAFCRKCRYRRTGQTRREIAFKVMNSKKRYQP